MKKQSVTQKVERPVKTTEDWYPTVNGIVNLKLYKNLHRNDDGIARVCIWGGDDYGLERDCPEQEAQELYDLIPDYVTQSELKDLGFIHS